MSTPSAFPTSPPGPGRRALSPGKVLVVLGLLAYLLFALLGGASTWHDHPSLPSEVREVSSRGRLHVFLSDYLGEGAPLLVETGVLYGAGFFASYEELTLLPFVEDEPGGGTRVTLRDPLEGLEGRRYSFVLTPDSPRPVRATTRVGEGNPRELEGTVCLDSLDWAGPGLHTCLFALHSAEDGGRCHRGWFSVER